jgi:RNA polymerase sigma factor (sigma-70 family)
MLSSNQSQGEVTILTNRHSDLQKLESEYLSKILGFSYLKTNTKEDAEDLTGEIVLQIIKYIHSGKEIGNFNAFVWKVSNNTLCKWLRNKRCSNTSYLNELIPSEDNLEASFFLHDEMNMLRREIGLLSKTYRETIILHYFEGKSCEEIALMQNKSAGTVKWWLYDARKFIKEGMTKMREYGEKSYHPGTLLMSCQCQPGADNEPMSCIKRKSTQNILLTAYKKPLSVEELCIELGISAPYIEDEVSYLVKNQLMKEANGRYQTDFVILPGQNTNLSEQIYETCFPSYFDELISVLENNKEILSVNPAGFEWKRLLWMYIHLFTDINLCRFKKEVCKIVMYWDIPDRPNGGKWIALGFENNFPSTGDYNCYKEYTPYDGPVHKGDNDMAQGFFHYWSGLDSSVFFNIPSGVFALCRQIILGELQISELEEGQKLLFSYAVEKNLFVKDNDCFRLNFCFIPQTQMEKIYSIANAFYEKARMYFEKSWKLVLAEYDKSVPKHLRWQQGNFLSNHLNTFVTCSLYKAYSKNLLSEPNELDRAWLSLFATE